MILSAFKICRCVIGRDLQWIMHVREAAAAATCRRKVQKSATADGGPRSEEQLWGPGGRGAEGRHRRRSSVFTSWTWRFGGSTTAIRSKLGSLLVKRNGYTMAVKFVIETRSECEDGTDEGVRRLRQSRTHLKPMGWIILEWKSPIGGTRGAHNFNRQKPSLPRIKSWIITREKLARKMATAC